MYIIFVCILGELLLLSKNLEHWSLLPLVQISLFKGEYIQMNLSEDIDLVEKKSKTFLGHKTFQHSRYHSYQT